MRRREGREISTVDEPTALIKRQAYKAIDEADPAQSRSSQHGKM